jgi:hypothetical protein
MSEILFQYVKVYPTTWVYLSSLLMLGLFFKFGRFWSVRNLDLLLLILLAPGLLLVETGRDKAVAALSIDSAPAALDESSRPETEPVPVAPDQVALVEAGESNAPAEDAEAGALAVGAAGEERAPSEGERELKRARSIELLGYFWLFGVAGLLLVRLLLDPTMVRRPLLEPNLSIGGLTFIGCSLFIFLMANVITSRTTQDDLLGPKAADQLLHRRAEERNAPPEYGPGLSVVYLLPNISTMTLREGGFQTAAEERINGYAIAAKAVAILSHLAVVLGIVLIGHWHFNNLKMGIGAAVLYLMLPYTAQMTGRVPHVLPAALLVWAVACYRRPVWAGAFIGLAVGVIYYPVFLLPLWTSFYLRRGAMRFAAGVGVTLALVASSLLFVSTDAASFWEHLKHMFGLWPPQMENLDGIWGLAWDPWYRITVLAAFFALAFGLALWPAQKNLGTLLSCSAAVMVAVQFWHAHGGGLYMAWYLPLLLLTIVRPNLEDRIAVSVLGEGWFTRRAQRTPYRPIDLAA